MSMISAQCDELRELANKLLEHGAFIGFGGTVNTDPLMLDAGTAMIDAAELIWQLRDDLQRANAENDRLRELLTDGERHLLEILGKNKRLQELVRDYESCTMHADCGRCEYDGTTSTHCPLSPCFPDIDELRKLGVEVDE